MSHGTRSALATLALAALALGGCDTLFRPGTPEEITSLPRSLSTTEEELIRASNRFELEYGKRLNRALIRMGMGVAFDPGSADLSRMAETPPCTAGTAVCLYIDWVRQKSFVEVNEEGTEAAAATGVGVGVTSGPVTFRVDRPFLFVIRERLSGTVLFVGEVVDPTAG